MYPKAKLPDGSTANVISWVWARTVTCPNPACGIEMPLASKWWLGKRKGREAYVVPTVVHDRSHPSGKRLEFVIGHDKDNGPTAENDGSVGRLGAECVACRTGVDLKYVRAEGREGRLGAQLMAVVAEGSRRRVYLAPDDRHRAAADIARPSEVPDAAIPPQAPSFRVQVYGMNHWADLFTNRQLVALTTFSDLVSDARERVLKDAITAGMSKGERIEAGGTGAAAYADAVATYLGLVMSRLADWSGNLCRWEAKAEVSQQVFGQQSVNMTWEFSESWPLGKKASGSWGACLNTVLRSLEQLNGLMPGLAIQADASTIPMNNVIISTDPPYYDNIGYSDLSDYFYTWQRRTLREIYPKLLDTMLVPKSEELVANPYRRGGKDGAKLFFEEGFRRVFERARESTLEGFPITIYYAYKQSETKAGEETSTGWETLLDGLIRSGWAITATWPMRTETASRLVAQGTNSLASSIVLTLRPRPEDAPTTDRRGFIATLQRELPKALRDLQHGAIAPVDLPQATIGPGMAVFTQFAQVVEADGSSMTVGSAIARINEIRDQVLHEQEGDFDATTRFAIEWYRQHGYGTGQFDDANNLARARVTSVDTMDREGILTSRAGKVTLLRPTDLPANYDVLLDDRTSAWEALHHLIRLLESYGVPAAGEFLAQVTSRADGAVDGDLVKELAFLLFSIAKDKWTKDALAFNTLVTAWSDIVDASRASAEPDSGQQASFDFDDE